jgi:hypothetical protein
MEDTAFGPTTWRDVTPAALVLVISLLGILFLVSQPTNHQRQLAVIVPPWDSVKEAAVLVAAAGGILVDRGGLPNVFIAISDRPDFSRALYRAGAWFVMNPIGAHGCLPTPPNSGTAP